MPAKASAALGRAGARGCKATERFRPVQVAVGPHSEGPAGRTHRKPHGGGVRTMVRRTQTARLFTDASDSKASEDALLDKLAARLEQRGAGAGATDPVVDFAIAKSRVSAPAKPGGVGDLHGDLVLAPADAGTPVTA